MILTGTGLAEEHVHNQDLRYGFAANAEMWNEAVCSLTNGNQWLSWKRQPGMNWTESLRNC